MLRELRNVVKNELVGVTLLVLLFLGRVGHDATDNLGNCIVELRVTTEFFAFLCVLMLICHSI